MLWCNLSQDCSRQKKGGWSYPLTHGHGPPAVSAGAQRSSPQPCWCSNTPATRLPTDREDFFENCKKDADLFNQILIREKFVPVHVLLLH